MWRTCKLEVVQLHYRPVDGEPQAAHRDAYEDYEPEGMTVNLHA